MASKVASASKLPPRTDQVPQLFSAAKKVIPSGVFTNVLTFLETRTDGHAVGLTCKAWAWLGPKCTLGLLNAELIKKIGKQGQGNREDPHWQRAERHVAACRARIENVRAIDICRVLHHTYDVLDLSSTLLQTYPGCVSFAYPHIPEDFYPTNGPDAHLKRDHAQFQAAFGSLPQTLTSVDMSGVHLSAERVFSYVRQNSHLTCLTLPPDAIFRGPADESTRSAQSLGCKLLGLRRLEIVSGYKAALPAELCTYILQGLPRLEQLSLVNKKGEQGRSGCAPFTHEPSQAAELRENLPYNKGLKRVEFTRLTIDQQILELFTRSCVTPPQVSFSLCEFASRFSFSMQLLPPPNSERKPEQKKP